MNQNNKIFPDFRGAVPLFNCEKKTKPNLLISMAFLVALGLLRAPGGIDG